METRARKFSSSIHKWYLQNGRKNLPWRKNITPYRVWISEIMLQQTQVKTVIPFYKKFMLRFPNLKAISEATEDEILALWTGLGFYRRAKNIYATKEIIKNKYKNRFPSNFDDLIKLPGIGKSTAGAILSIAYKKPAPILDANVKRVISRHDDIDLQDKKSIAEVLDNNWVSTAGPEVAKFEAALKKKLNVRNCIALNSGTSALHLALKSFDIGPGDITGELIDSNLSINASLICREETILCGKAWFEESFVQLDPKASVIWNHKEGDLLSKHTEVATLNGNARCLVASERTGLNFLQMMSGIAYKTYVYVNELSGSNTILLDTRKTLPGLRYEQKYSVKIGGGENHRMGLFDAALVKKSH